MRRELLILCSILFGFAAVPGAAKETKRVALVIGNSDYIHAGSLANPRNDADDISAAFERIGFKVLKGTNLDKAGMDRLIRRFARSLRRAQVGAFFYAGHGIQVGGKNYLVPVDAQLEDATGIDFELTQVDVVQRAMERGSSSNLIFLDACRNNPLARNLTRAMGTRGASIGRGLATVESGVGTLISFSTQPGNVALDGEGRNSPYAAALAKYIDRPGDNISDILINVRKEVMRATNGRQIPWEHTALTDRIVFVPKSVGKAAPTQRPLNSPRGTRQDSDYYRKTLKEMQRMREALQKLTRERDRLNAAPKSGRASTLPAGTTHRHDGRWEVSVGDLNRYCPGGPWTFRIRITDGKVSGGRRIRGGSVDRNGMLEFEHSGRRNPSAILRYEGQLSKSTGEATMHVVGRRCRGAVKLSRMPQ